jgi:hypothetical protein
MQSLKFPAMICVCALVFTASVRADDNAAQAAARAAVLAQLAQIDAATPTPAPAPAPIISAPVIKPQPAPVQTLVVTEPVVSQPPTVAVITADDNAAQARARAMLAKEQVIVTQSTAQTTSFLPVNAPALPISGSKETRLQALNEQYKSGQISPQDYFNQREAILNGN